MIKTLIHSFKRVQAEKGAKKARFFLIKSVLFAPYSIRWLRYVNTYFPAHTGHQPPLELVRTKFTRSYYSRRWTPRTRLEQLCAHHDFVAQAFSAECIAQLLSGAETDLGVIAGKSGASYRFYIAQHERYRHEGELTLFMRRGADPAPLAALTFSLGRRDDNALVMRIGGLQGPQADNAKQLVIDATRDLSGLRPKAIALHVAYTIANALQCSGLEAVARGDHPLNNERHAFVANNDLFWEECGAWRERRIGFVLPGVLAQKSLEEVPAKKRKDWLARQAIKESLTTVVHTSLLSLMAPREFQAEPLHKAWSLAAAE